MSHSQTGDFVTSFPHKASGNRIRRHFLLTDFQWMIPREPIATWSGVDFTVCCGSLFVVEMITVTDLVANKISGSGSCLIGKLQNSPHNWEASCCLVSTRQKGNHKIHRRTHALYFTLPDQPQQTTKYTTKSFCLSVEEFCLFIELNTNTHSTKVHAVTQS